ncbi:MAG TPA: nucleoside deaminase [Candidatus Omnitrophota bacterium]|nr:nucleoside deaminase [Candidatus Omnitrophota bacterium]HPT07822.1 nucleoside deaminase [Candidatus Omnitrophota bacterium]
MKKQRIIPEADFMHQAINEAFRNCTQLRGGPFGAAIVRNGKLLAKARNSVLVHDATAHAEMNAIRLASRKMKTFDLSGCIIYSTTEPCPMCFSAIHWARIDAVIFGTSTEDAQKAGFHELLIDDKTLQRLGKSTVQLFPGFMRQECNELFEVWQKLPGRKYY